MLTSLQSRSRPVRACRNSVMFPIDAGEESILQALSTPWRRTAMDSDEKWKRKNLFASESVCELLLVLRTTQFCRGLATMYAVKIAVILVIPLWRCSFPTYTLYLPSCSLTTLISWTLSSHQPSRGMIGVSFDTRITPCCQMDQPCSGRKESSDRRY